jgi:hypothetical protein
LFARCFADPRDESGFHPAEFANGDHVFDDVAQDFVAPNVFHRSQRPDGERLTQAEIEFAIAGTCRGPEMTAAFDALYEWQATDPLRFCDGGIAEAFCSHVHASLSRFVPFRRGRRFASARSSAAFTSSHHAWCATFSWLAASFNAVAK